MNTKRGDPPDDRAGASTEVARQPGGPIDRGDSVAAAVSEVGDRWTFLVLREAFYGVQRFTELHGNLGIARNILSNRLSRLVAKGILERRVGPGSLPAHYRLTAKGRDFYPVALALMQWADRWVIERPTARPAHRDCGGPLETVVRCTRCERTLGAHEATYGDAAIGEG
jgi:DNA-binding HxlR family transcriptional regulator